MKKREMYHEMSGSGCPSLVFVHGFACDHTDWAAQVDGLSNCYRVVTCDLRGHGNTPGEPQDCSIETYAADVAELVDSLQLAPAVLVGHSMGCRVVLEAARQRPQIVAGLVLVDSSFIGTGDPAAAELATSQKIAATGFPKFSEDFFNGMFFTRFERMDEITERASKLPVKIGSALFPRISRWDAEYMGAALAKVQVPLMVIQSTYMGPSLRRESLHGGQTSQWLDLIRANARDARIEIIPGAGHFVHMERAEQVNTLIHDFLSSPDSKFFSSSASG